MKAKLVLPLLAGMLLWINGFEQLWALFFTAESLEVTRQNGWWSFSIRWLADVSRWLSLVSGLGLISLVLASLVSLATCKKMQGAKHNVTVALLLAFIIDKPLIANFLFFGYRNRLFANFSMHVLFLSNFLVAAIIGLIFLKIPLYYKYF